MKKQLLSTLIQERNELRSNSIRLRGKDKATMNPKRGLQVVSRPEGHDNDVAEFKARLREVKARKVAAQKRQEQVESLKTLYNKIKIEI